MQKYPMLMGVDEDRVERVGGKAAILEEIVRRWPKHNIPKFKVYADDLPSLSMLDNVKRVFRASSELDLFGGCGLHNSFHDVDYSNYGKVIEQIVNPPDKERIKLFAESIGKSFTKPTVIPQFQSSPKYWVVALQHPNNDNILLINYADGPSAETKKIDFIGTHDHLKSFAKKTFTAIYDLSKSKLISGKKEDIDLIEQIAINYLVIKDLGIIHRDYTSILEMGVYNNQTETYQFTPITKKLDKQCEVSEDTLIFGACNTTKLPVINIPPTSSVRYYINTRSEEEHSLSDYPLFKYYLDAILKEFPMSLKNRPEIAVWSIMSRIEYEFPDGYLAIADVDKNQEFDIPMRKVRAVMVGSWSNPLFALNHGISRLIYKSPVLIFGNIEGAIPDKEPVTFSCNGSTYNLS